MSHRIRAVEHRCAAGKIQNFLENFRFFVMYRYPEMSFPFPLLRHYEMPECFYVKNCCFELVQQFYHATEFGNVANTVSACADQP